MDVLHPWQLLLGTLAGCMLANSDNCVCADVQSDGVLDTFDVTVFVADLLVGTGCP